MTQYFVDFENKTGFGQHLNFCVYIQIPEPPHSDSVAWLISSLSNGAVSTVSWKIDRYLVALAHYIQKKNNIGVYHTIQVATVILGSVWEIIDYPKSEKNHEETQTIIEHDNATASNDSIKIINTSRKAADCGIGMWGSACVFERNIRAGSTTSFKVAPEYWVGVFITELQKGQVIDDTIALASNRIKFEGDNNVAIIIAKAEESSSLPLSLSY
ncbi:4934_t:CDS:2 [Funneliformis geosporum]|uniref:13936_t:CDS:1 n=1 Tax=Funneliformis geosporum TaxID=1117311 RepID=A0A9W4WVU2_9GLOM|nr:4934_t:CDS:2 [Funneliformis geosporum]CAI2182802.1 13936_t:CDS:2 [Funneliformis geosporum]